MTREPHTLIRGARPVPLGSASPGDVVDIRVEDGFVREARPGLRPQPNDEVFEGDGRWLVPGLWDEHVHMRQWAETKVRVDVSGTSSPGQVARIIRDHIATLPRQRRAEPITGWGYRIAAWSDRPTVAELDAVSGEHPVALASGDGHNGWLNSRALALFGAPRTDTVLEENDWYPVRARLSELRDDDRAVAVAYREAVADAAAKGIVGIVDMEFGAGFRDWPERFAVGIDQLRVRTATYPDGLDDVIAAGLRSGDDLPGGGGLIEMGPLKIISDGSLNTRTARCFEPYEGSGPPEDPRGTQNFSLEELTGMMARAREGGLEASVHAIGDAALATALDAFESSRASGSIEHAQLVRWDDVARMARLGLRASVQPAHLLDDRDVTMRIWRDRADRCFAFRSMLDAGVMLRFGSDAPVSPLDPWLAMAAAVHRSGDERDAWNPAEAITPAEALASSTGGMGRVREGSRADLVLLDDDPLADRGDAAATAQHLRGMRVAATFTAGRPTYLAL